MRSTVAITYELDDAQEAARELADSIDEKLIREKNTVGILFCDADMDGATVTGELSERLGIEIVGMTTLAAIYQDGYQDSAAVLTVLTSDDCIFTASVSEPLTKDNYERKIVESYRATVPDGAGPDYRSALLFAYCPNQMPFSADKYAEILEQAAGSVPIIGGVASDDYEYIKARVFLSGSEYSDSIAFLNVSGPVKPLFSLRHVTSDFAERTRTVTHAVDNTVYTVGDETFVQYLEGFGLKTDVDDVLLSFNPYPMMLTRDDDDEVPLMRHITGLNLEDGSGSCVGDVPVGTKANICLLNKKDIVTSCRESMQALLEMAEQSTDYEYSTLFCITCCGRALLLGGDSTAEGDVITELLQDGITLSGVYCFGELCPTRYKDGDAINRFHNCSIAFCLI